MKNKDKIIGSVAVLIIFVIFLLFGFLNKEKDKYDDNDIFVESSSNTTEASSKSTETSSKKVDQIENKIIKVQIKGEVKDPGVYTLEQGARVEDLIKLSGGVTADADIDKVISQAKKLKDEECITIPKKGDGNYGSLEVNSPIMEKNSSISDSEKVNINTATKEELMQVPGIGEVIATSIIKYRENNGDFKSLEDLKKVDRIGDKTFEKMKDKLEVN